MKRKHTLLFLFLLISLSACHSEGQTTLGFNTATVSLIPSLSRRITLTLSNGENISSLVVRLTSSQAHVATVSPSSCNLSSSVSSCVVTISGVTVGEATISATPTSIQWHVSSEANTLQLAVTSVAVSVGESYVPTTQFGVLNNCGFTLWMQSINAPSDADAVVMIPSRHAHDYAINYPAYVPAFRVWPKKGCDEDGQNCDTGQQLPPCPNNVCQPPVDSLWEGTFNFSLEEGGTATSFDTSLVNGFTLPFNSTVIKGADETSEYCLDTDASAIQLTACPTNDNLSTPANQMTAYGSDAFGPYPTYPDGSTPPVIRNLTSVNLQSTYPTTNQVEACIAPQTIMTYTDANGFGGLNLGANSASYSPSLISPVILYTCGFNTEQLQTKNPSPASIQPGQETGFDNLSDFCNDTPGYCDTGGSDGPAAAEVCNLGPVNFTQYVQYIHANTTNLYAQTFDDTTGNLICYSSKTKYLFTLCP